MDNLWMGGKESFSPIPFGGSTIDFQNGVANIFYDNRPIDIYHTSANISDSLGNLLFYTNGVVIGNNQGDTMVNGTGLNPSEYTNDWYPEGLLIYQANIIIPKPDHPDAYLLFHSTIDTIPLFGTKYLYLSEINMNLAGGLGAVIAKNTVIFNGALQSGRLNAVRHGNGRDWWVYAHESDSDVFLRWLVTPSGLSGPFTQAVGRYRPLDAGQVSFSPDGSRFAYYTGDTTGLDLFLVNRCDGLFTLTGHVDVPDVQYGVGVSFSQSGRFVYLSAVTELYQADAWAPDPQASLLHIATWDSTYSPSPPFATLFGASKLAPDGKIYISTLNGTDKLHVINEPDSLGLACDLVQHGITLPTYWKNSLPNHPNYHLGPLVGSPCDTLNLGVAEQDVRLNLSLYPNPNAGSFSLSFAPQPDAGVVEVFDVNGRVVLSEAVAPWSQLKRLELVGLSAGVYQCRLRFGQAMATKRFVIE